MLKPMTDEDIFAAYNAPIEFRRENIKNFWDIIYASCRSVIAARDAQWKQMLAARKPEAWLADDQPDEKPTAVVAVDGMGQISVGWIEKPNHNDKLYVRPVPAIPLESSEEANNAINAMLAEYNYPVDPQSAGRAGWRAARLYAKENK